MNTMHVRTLLTALFLASGIVLLMPTGSAQAETWCRRDLDRDNPVCVFATARDCIRAAVIMGGACERQQLGQASEAKPCKSSREASAARKRRVAGSETCDAS